MIDKLGEHYFYRADYATIADNVPDMKPVLKKMRELPHLKFMMIIVNSDTAIEKENWEEIAQLTSLEELTLEFNHLAEPRFEEGYLKQLIGLRSLTLLASQLPRLDPISELANLEKLSITTDEPIAISELEKLRTLQDLKWLIYDEHEVTSVKTEKMAFISRTFLKLEWLALSQPVQLDDLRLFQNHPALKVIVLDKEHKKDEARIRAMLPNVKIVL